MADITMCRGTGCAVKGRCYRHVAKPSDLRQSWFLETPGKDETCEAYWPMFREIDETTAGKGPGRDA